MKKVINEFKLATHIAIAGVSRTSKGKWGNTLMKELMKIGIKVYPINPIATEIDGIKCYQRLRELPFEVQSLIIATRPEVTLQLVMEAKDSGIKRVFMQKGSGKGSATPEAIQYCKDNNIDYVYGVCPMMIYGMGGHKFHYWVRKTIGGLPTELYN